MRPARLFWTLIIAAAAALSLTDCSDDEGCEPGAPCPCAGARGCIYNCPDAGCRPICNDVDFCAATCGDTCSYQCTRVNACDVECDAGCATYCADVSDCRAYVGPGSEVTCERLSNCEVSCRGACRVTCTNVSACNVECAEGDVTDCGNGVKVCGQPC